MFIYKGITAGGYTVCNNQRLVGALRAEHNNLSVVPVLLEIKLTHLKEVGDLQWLGCSESDEIDGERHVYNNIYGEYVMAAIHAEADLWRMAGSNQVIDLSRRIEFYFNSVDMDLEVKVLKSGEELRQRRGKGRRLHSLSPQAVTLDSFAYIS